MGTWCLSLWIALISQGSSGVDMVALVHGVLERNVSLSKKVVSEHGAAAPHRVLSGERMSSRCDLLTSVLVDRAYSGKTGNKADVLLGNLFGLNTQVVLLTRFIVAPLQLMLRGHTKCVTHKSRPKRRANM